jgi:hypothetical protein
MALDPPGWFWHDFPDAAWAEVVRKLPSEDAAAFEQTIRERLHRLLEGAERRTPIGGRPAPSTPSPIGRDVVQGFLSRTTEVRLPTPIGLDGLRVFAGG